MSTAKYMMLSMAASVVGALATFLIYRWRARVDLDKKGEDLSLDLKAKKIGNEIDAQAVPIKLLTLELGKREAELTLIREQDRKERAQYVETLTAMKKALDEIVTDLRAHRDEERERSASLHRRLDGVDDRLLVIETRLELKDKS